MLVGLDYRPALIAPNSGIGRQVRALETYLSRLPEVQVQRFGCLPAGHPLRQQVETPVQDIPLLGQHRPRQRLAFEAGFLPQRLRQLKTEVYIATANMGLPLGRAPGVRQVLMIHDLFQLTQVNRHASAWHAKAYRLIDWASIAYSVARSTRIWTPSAFTAAEIAAHFPRARQRIQLLPNLVELPSVAPSALPGLPPGYWLAVGTREPRKNISRLVAAWHDARQLAAVPDLVLLGEEADLPPGLRDLPGLICLAGLDECQLKGLYQGADRLWQPSYAEGFGLPVVEALAMGTPVVSALGSSLDEVTPPWSPRFDALDVPALTRLMVELAAPARRDERGPAWSERFAGPAYGARLSEALQDLLQ